MKSHLPPRKVGALVDFRAFLQPSYTLYTIGTFLAFWGLYTPFFYAPAYAQTVNTPSNLAPYILPIMNVKLSFVVANNRQRPFSVGYYRTLLQTSLGLSISLYPPLLHQEHSYLAGLEYQHGRDSSYLRCYTAFSLELSSVYPRLESVHSQIRMR
jgi:MFS transporter, MCT family, solute carrier family 16 (monocarboxylic acid transporters), member 3